MLFLILHHAKEQEERCRDKRNLHVMQQFHQQRSKVPDVKQCWVRFPKHLESLFVKEMSRRIKAEGNLEGNVKFVRLSAPVPWGSEVWPAMTSGSPGPLQSRGVNQTWTLTFYLLPTDFRQHFNWFTFSALTCATQPETTKPHHFGSNQWGLHTRKLCFRRPNISHRPRGSLYFPKWHEIPKLRLEWCWNFFFLVL